MRDEPAYENVIVARRTLFLRIVDLDPVTVGISQPDLLHIVDTRSDHIFPAVAILVRYIVLLQYTRESLHRRNRKTYVAILVIVLLCIGAFNDVQGDLRTDVEPGMLTVVKRLGDRIQANDIAIERRARLTIHHKNSHVVDRRLGLGALRKTYRYQQNESNYQGRALIHISAIYETKYSCCA